jgi:acyl-CoA hydrolase
MPPRIAAAPARRITPQEAAGFVTSGMWIDYGAGLCQPDAFDSALARRTDELRGVKIRNCLTMRPRAVLAADPNGEHFFWISLHFAGYDRRMHDAGIASYLPVNLGEIPDYYRRFIEPVDIVVLKTCPMDANGYFNFSAANLWHGSVIERARMVIVEESAGLPYAMGEQTGVHLSEVDYILAWPSATTKGGIGHRGTETQRFIGRAS